MSRKGRDARHVGRHAAGFSVLAETSGFIGFKGCLCLCERVWRAIRLPNQQPHDNVTYLRLFSASHAAISLHPRAVGWLILSVHIFIYSYAVHERIKRQPIKGFLVSKANLFISFCLSTRSIKEGWQLCHPAHEVLLSALFFLFLLLLLQVIFVQATGNNTEQTWRRKNRQHKRGVCNGRNKVLMDIRMRNRSL